MNLSDIISAVKEAVKSKANECWDDEKVNNAVTAAECKLTPNCDKSSSIDGAKFDEAKKKSVMDAWEANNCGLSYE